MPGGFEPDDSKEESSLKTALPSWLFSQSDATDLRLTLPSSRFFSRPEHSANSDILLAGLWFSVASNRRIRGESCQTLSILYTYILKEKPSLLICALSLCYENRYMKPLPQLQWFSFLLLSVYISSKKQQTTIASPIFWMGTTVDSNVSIHIHTSQLYSTPRK